MRWWAAELDRHVCSRALGATRYRSPEAVHMLAAIALQESGGNALFQRRADGWPRSDLARGLWQFELAGVLGLASHPAAVEALDELDHGLGWQVRIAPEQVWQRLAWDVVLACRIARALLWTVPRPLPAISLDAEDDAWSQYVEAWRPGRPHRERWRTVWQALTESLT